MAGLKNLVLNVSYVFGVLLVLLGIWAIKVKYGMYHDERITEWTQAKRRWDEVCKGKDPDSLGLDSYCSRHHKIIATDPSGLAALDLLYMLVLCDYLNCVDLASVLAANIGRIYFGMMSLLGILAFIVYFGCIRSRTSGFHGYSLPVAQGNLSMGLHHSIDPYYGGGHGQHKQKGH